MMPCHSRLLRVCMVFAAVLALAACGGFPQSRLELQTAERWRAQPSAQASDDADLAQDGASQAVRGTFYEPGSDRLVQKSQQPSAAATRAAGCEWRGDA